MKIACLLPALCALALPLHAAPVVLVDVITDDLEHGQNAEPSLAVNPSNPQQAFLSTFDTFPNPSPIFHTSDGGATWSVFDRATTFDSTLAWPAGGSPYLAHLNGERFAGVVVRKGTAPFAATGKFSVLPGASYLPNDVPDQPWVTATRVGGVDRLYVGLNDLSQRSGKTATVYSSLNGGVTWRRTVIERFRPPVGSDGPPVRVAAVGDTVYAAFLPGLAFGPASVFGHVVVVKDTAAGLHDFGDLAGGPGVIAAAERIFPQGDFGEERIGSDLSIAVDPANADHVYVAFGSTSPDGLPIVEVVASKDGGNTWVQIYETRARAALPAIAVSGNGTVGLLYTAYLYLKFETHLVQTTDDFAHASDTLISRFVGSSVTPDFAPFIGDYQMLIATADRFHAAFSASNETSLWPQPPTFLRNAALIGNRVPLSIDPFYYATDAITAAPTMPAGPTAFDDLLTFTHPGDAAAFVALNDIDPGGDVLSVKSVGAPSHGTTFKAGTGSVVFLPDKTFAGTDSFTYTIVNSLGQTSTATVQVRNPFQPLAGHFTGLVTNAPADHATRGVIALTLTREGDFTGSLTLAGKKYAFRGEFALDGSAVATIQLATSPITLVLSLDLVTGLLSGSTGDGVFASTFSARRAAFPRGTTSANAGYHTFGLPHDPANVLATVPHGDGFGSVTVSANGQCRAAGSLADGTKFSHGVTITNDGVWSLYVLLYGGKGSLSGDVPFADLVASDLASSAVAWIKPRAPKDARYQDGFNTTLTLAGSRYVKPTTAGPRPILAAQGGLGRAHFQGGGLTVSIDPDFQLSVAGKFTADAPNTAALSITLTAATGLYSGTFKPTGATTATKFTGAVVTKANEGFGFFLGQLLSGRASLTARLP